MDLFTEKANSIIKKLDDNKSEHIVYSSDEEMPEEDAETTTSLTRDDLAAGLDKQTMAAINLAQKLSTQAAKSGVPGFRTNPQQAINQAYGKLMTGLAAKLSKIKI